MASTAAIVVGLGGLSFAAIGLWMHSRKRLVRLERERYIRSYVFSASLLASLNELHPQLDEGGRFLVARALRQFFLVHTRAEGRLIAMPSKVADDLWHAFILHTRDYERFCGKAFGRFFHHVPAEAMPKGGAYGAGLLRTWRLACLEENINPARPTRLPLLFAIDDKLRIVGGQHHDMHALAASRDNSSGCGGSSCGSSSNDGNDAGGGDGGCGGGGCGGGD
jgi:hypothetical protein